MVFDNMYLHCVIFYLQLT